MKTIQHGKDMQDLEVYPFWKIKEGQELVVRFLPDLNEYNNYGFIDEYAFHRIEIDGKLTTALCSAVHEDRKKCYHCMVAKRAYETNSLKDRDNRKYWRKKQYTGNVLIIEDPLGITDPENPKTYRLPLGKMLFDKLKEGLLGHRILEIPSDYFKGNNFAITKQMLHHQYPSYSGEFKKASCLTLDQITLAKDSLVDLSTFRPELYSSSCNDELSKDLMWGILSES